MTNIASRLSRFERLRMRMRQLGIREEDLRESFIRSSRPGGQNVNKTSTCVCVRHLPSGLEARAQQERSQRLNRYYARKALLDKIEEFRRAQSLAEQARLQKLRLSRKKRSPRLAALILEEKRRRSEKKKLRACVREEE